MSRVAILAPLGAVILAACGGPPPAPEPMPVEARVDTVVVTREVAPPLPDGQSAMICLASGQNLEIRISPAGDTLVGPRRVRLMDLGPAIGFVGTYASHAAWFVSDEPIVFENQRFSKFGQRATRDCRSMKIVGAHRGVNLFAETTASSPFRALYVPVSPGVFQGYQAQVGRVRG